MSDKIQRYTTYPNGEMRENPLGEFIKNEDHVAAVKVLTDKIAELETEIFIINQNTAIIEPMPLKSAPLTEEELALAEELDKDLDDEEIDEKMNDDLYKNNPNGR